MHGNLASKGRTKETIYIRQKVLNIVVETTFEVVRVFKNLSKHFKYKRVAELQIMSRKRNLF